LEKSDGTDPRLGMVASWLLPCIGYPIPSPFPAPTGAEPRRLVKICLVKNERRFIIVIRVRTDIRLILTITGRISTDKSGVEGTNKLRGPYYLMNINHDIIFRTGIHTSAEFVKNTVGYSG